MEVSKSSKEVLLKARWIFKGKLRKRDKERDGREAVPELIPLRIGLYNGSVV